MPFKTALKWTSFWVGLALLYGGGIYWHLGPKSAVDFFTSYIVEYSLSMDNLFVFIIIFEYFGAESAQQRTALNWGLIGAVALRAIFVFGGLEAVRHFEWLLYLMGLF